MDQPWLLHEDLAGIDVGNYAGFVYEIEHLPTGRLYVGKKFTTKTRKGKVSESDWRNYWGSSKHLKADIERFGKQEFRRTIISVHSSQTETDYAEFRELFARDVLRAKDENGELIYYNRAITSRWFRAPIGRTRPQEERDRIAKAAKGRIKSPETIKKLKEANKGKRPSVKCLEAGRLAAIGREPWNKGSELSKQHKAKVAASTKEAMASPEVQERLKEGYLKRERAKLAKKGLSESDILAIRCSPERSGLIARAYGICPTLVAKIRSGARYAWVGL